MQVLVIGAGQMGQGIAQLAAQSGCDVQLFDAAGGAAAAAKARIARILARLTEKGRLHAADAQLSLSRITPIENLELAKDSKLVIEAIVEDAQIKSRVFERVSQIVSADTIIATNTSSLSVTELARAVEGPDRFIGLHFFNPVR